MKCDKKVHIHSQRQKSFVSDPDSVALIRKLIASVLFLNISQKCYMVARGRRQQRESSTAIADTHFTSLSLFAIASSLLCLSLAPFHGEIKQYKTAILVL